MRIIKQLCLVIGIVMLLTNDLVANDILQIYIDKIEKEQKRIDLIDSVEDQYVSLKSETQGDYATKTYLTTVNHIVSNILSNVESNDIQKIDQLRRVEGILRDVSTKNVHFYTRFSPIFTLILKVQRIENDQRLMSVLKSNVFVSLNLIAFYIDQPIARSFLIEASRIEPAEVLLHYKEIDYKPFSGDVLAEVVRVAPMKIKTYLHSWNPVHQRIKTSSDRMTIEVYDIFRRKGGATRAFVLINDIFNGKLSIDEAHEIAKYDSTFFEYLISMQADESLNGKHSVDEALKHQCLKQVRVINDLHEESDAVRFASLAQFNASEIYTLMVYSEEEIYTSTFLGMYQRMMKKMQVESAYEFLHHLNFMRFRTFIKMAAGYNELNSFIAKMTSFEKDRLFKKLVSGLEKENDNLGSAVTVADTYGSLKSDESKQIVEEHLLDYYTNIPSTNLEEKKLYRLLIQVFGLSQEFDEIGHFEKLSQELKALSKERLFKEGKNIQQHFFFDDPDGRASYAHFLGTFRNGNWEIFDNQTFVLVKSTSGQIVEIYANKPSTEYAGQDAIKSIFEKNGRWPDIVVHRGHSYYVSAAIESLTPSTEVVFLGSCGGYNNISQVLKYSPDAQIISSKQIGTMLVNDKLCLELNEMLRKGEDLVWEKLWSKLKTKFAIGSPAYSRFQDYIPPHKNLGALLIKTYRRII